MAELYRHVGPDTDVPAGDIGVGGREVGYLAGYMKKIIKPSRLRVYWPWSFIRWELNSSRSNGVWIGVFAQAMLAEKGDSFLGKTVLVQVQVT